QHYGIYSCRRLYGRDSGSFSEHATANAIDLAAFTIDNGQQVSVLRDWDDDGAKGAFLREVHEGGCAIFGTSLGPDYNTAHADHFHLDMRGWNSCR
ncbi:MAG: extensin family protein, partial [Sphingomonadaceae bacterium]|nr:extensin family protein [Sphingomonadaceae bacterium]